MSALEKLQNEVERQKRKIEEIEKSIETVEKEFNEKSIETVEKGFNVKFDDERKDIKEQKAFINEPDLQIAIVGTIKAGKSTFINALFEENIASTDVTPEPASLTKFRYSTKNKLEVKFYNKAEWDELWESVEEAERLERERLAYIESQKKAIMEKAKAKGYRVMETKKDNKIQLTLVREVR